MPIGDFFASFENRTVAWPYKYPYLEDDGEDAFIPEVTFQGEPVMWQGSLEVTW